MNLTLQLGVLSFIMLVLFILATSFTLMGLLYKELMPFGQAFLLSWILSAFTYIIMSQGG